MKNIEVSFKTSLAITAEKIYFDQKNQVVFVGRSNVGKSSLMNAIFGKKNLVKTSSMPGKTQTANIFLVNNKYEFVDLPGYWFAKHGQEKKQELEDLISWYIEEFSPYIKKIVIVIDSKVGPTQTDIEMFPFLQEFNLPLLFVLNKIDKTKQKDLRLSLQQTQKLFFGQQILLTSATNHQWVPNLQKVLLQAVAEK